MTNVNPFPDDPSQPRPVRIATWVAGVILAVLGLLPLLGVALSAEAIGAASLVLGVMLPGVGILVERQVTPLSSPRSAAGVRLVEVRRGGVVNPLDAGNAL